MIDIFDTTLVRSDQLNSDDLIGGPITVTITKVSKTGEGEQPISVSYEGDNGKPYKPGKTCRRILMGVWGRDASKYVGKSMTLFRDEKVQFGGLVVGGIRISHMSDIGENATLALMVTKGKKKAFTIKPLVLQKTQTQPTQSPAIPYTEDRERFVIDQLSLSPDLDILASEWKSYWPEVRFWAEEPRARATTAKDARKLILTPTDEDKRKGELAGEG